MHLHHYSAVIQWTGNRGEGTVSYKGYDRSHTIQFENKAVLQASSDPSFMGDPSRYNPEELLLASLSSCHMLWYLHICMDHGISVIGYTDHASGTMLEEKATGGRFTEVLLRPEVIITDASKIDLANTLHAEAHRLCFIANSVNFPVRHEPTCKSAH